MPFFAAVKTFPGFLLKVVCSWGLRPLFLILSVSFNSGPRYLVYFVEIFLLRFALGDSVSLALIFCVFTTEVVV
jgi:hypothetical protein